MHDLYPSLLLLQLSIQCECMLMKFIRMNRLIWVRSNRLNWIESFYSSPTLLTDLLSFSITRPDGVKFGLVCVSIPLRDDMCYFEIWELEQYFVIVYRVYLEIPTFVAKCKYVLYIELNFNRPIMIWYQEWNV